MKILYITRVPIGTMGEPAIHMFATIAAQDHDVLVLEPAPHNASEPYISQSDSLVKRNIYALDTKQQVAKAYSHIRQFCPDIIHMTQSPHCFYYPYYLKHLTPKTKWFIDFRSPHVGPKDSPALKRYFYLQFYVDAVLTHSITSLKTNIKHLFRKPVELPPGVNLKLFAKNDKVGKTDEVTRFVFISSISKTRKIPFLITAFNEFAKKTDRSVTLDIYGDGNATDELLKLIQKRQTSNCIFYHGRVDQLDLLKKLPDYDAGIAYVPYENFTFAPSLKSLEYAAAGLPVIASDTEGHKEYNRKHNFNFIMFGNSIENFIDVMQKYMQVGIPIDHINKNMVAVKKFDWNHIVSTKLIPLYKKYTI